MKRLAPLALLLLVACARGSSFQTPTGPWTVEASSGSPLLVAVATTLDRTTRYTAGVVPDVSSLAHEYHHVLTTHWVRYLWSHTFNTCYWKLEEAAANAYQVDPANRQPWLQAIAGSLRRAAPAAIPTVTINHPISLVGCP